MGTVFEGGEGDILDAGDGCRWSKTPRKGEDPKVRVSLPQRRSTMQNLLLRVFRSYELARRSL